MLDGRFEHNNSETDERLIQRHKVRQECKCKASDEPGEKPNKIITTEIAKQDTTDLLPGDVKWVRQGIYRRWRKTQPRLPKSREETHEALDQYEAFSNQDEKMIYINSSETNIVMLSTENVCKRSTFLCANINSKNVRKRISTTKTTCF